MPDLNSTLAVLPTISRAYAALYASLWKSGHIPPTVIELCRLRLAQLHNSAAELQRVQIALSDEKRASLSDWHTQPLYSDAEKACIAFAEVYAMDAQAITDAHADAVKAHYGDSGLVLLVEALGVLDGRIRIALLLAAGESGSAGTETLL